MTSANTEKSLAEDRGAATPKISVIVPVYKVEKYLPECIESVLAQTFTDFELILVDDGSPDNSGAICDAYAARAASRDFSPKNAEKFVSALRKATAS